MSKHQRGRLSNSQWGDTLHAVITLNLKAKGFLIPSFIRIHVSQAQNIDVAPADTLQLNPQDPLLVNKRRQICFGLTLSSSFLVFWAGWMVLEGGGGWVFHVPVFRCLLFLSIWSRSLGQQTGDSIRCFEVVHSVLSLHFLFSLPVSPPAFVALIRKVPGHV